MKSQLKPRRSGITDDSFQAVQISSFFCETTNPFVVHFDLWKFAELLLSQTAIYISHYMKGNIQKSIIGGLFFVIKNSTEVFRNVV